MCVRFFGWLTFVVISHRQELSTKAGPALLGLGILGIIGGIWSEVFRGAFKSIQCIRTCCSMLQPSRNIGPWHVCQRKGPCFLFTTETYHTVLVPCYMLQYYHISITYPTRVDYFHKRLNSFLCMSVSRSFTNSTVEASWQSWLLSGEGLSFA